MWHLPSKKKKAEKKQMGEGVGVVLLSVAFMIKHVKETVGLCFFFN